VRLRQGGGLHGLSISLCSIRAATKVFDGAWIEPGQHIVTIVGSNVALVQGSWLREGRRESDDETARHVDFITNWRESVEQERQAALFGPLEKGTITWDKIHELGEILNGTFAGRTSVEQVSFHANNNGTAAADLPIAQWVYLQCKRMGQ
jgi:ornithine cyclodeaminase/alanine dehydrogenase-like protein (mu-crystallin family)